MVNLPSVPILTSIWYRDLGRSADDIKYLIKRVRESYLDGIELSIDYPLLHKREIPKVIGTYLRHEGMYLTIHLPWRDLELASPLNEIRKASLRIILNSIEELAVLEPTYFITHLTTEQDNCGYMCRDCIDAAKESVSALSDKVREVGIPLLIETTHEKCCSGDDTLPYILEEVITNPYVGVCLDPIHLITRRLRRWGSAVSLIDLVNDLPPIIINKVEELHLHGFRELGLGITYVHLIPSNELLKEYASVIKESLLRDKVKLVVIEAYKDDYGNDVELSRVKSIVREFKGMIR